MPLPLLLLPRLFPPCRDLCILSAGFDPSCFHQSYSFDNGYPFPGVVDPTLKAFDDKATVDMANGMIPLILDAMDTIKVSPHPDFHSRPHSLVAGPWLKVMMMMMMIWLLITREN